VSVRDFTGQRSLPTTVCKDAIADVPATDPPLTCKNYRDLLATSTADAREDSDVEAGVGCTLPPAPRPEPARAWTCLGLLGVWLYRRARRARRAT
jgi:hypothetical protein